MTPRLLLVEDDPASRTYLTAVLDGLPATVDAAGSVAEALSAKGPHALWLLDANLPDGSGIDLLARLRGRDSGTPALAHTADTTSATRDRLLAAGFATVLVKPLGVEALLCAVRAALGQSSPSPATIASVPAGELPVWDEAAALAALKGNAGNVATLRQLFLSELPKQRAAIVTAAQLRDADALHRELHRLKASCGFVGAARLQAAAEAFDRALPDVSPLDAFDEVARATLA